MSTGQAFAISTDAYGTPGLPRSALVAGACRALTLWVAHRRMRRELLGLTRAQLKDAGITAEALRNALDRPFWKCKVQT